MSDFGRPRKPASNLVLLVVVALTLFAAGCSHRSATSQQPANPAAADFATALRNRVTTDAMMAHLSKLQDIANANNGTRAVGTPGYEASIDYVVNTLRGKGFDVQTPEFSARVFHAEKGSVSLGGKNFDARALEYSLGTPAGRGERAASVRAGRRHPGMQRLRLRQAAGAGRGGAGGARQVPVRAEGRRRGAAGRRGDDRRRQRRRAADGRHPGRGHRRQDPDGERHQVHRLAAARPTRPSDRQAQCEHAKRQGAQHHRADQDWVDHRCRDGRRAPGQRAGRPGHQRQRLRGGRGTGNRCAAGELAERTQRGTVRLLGGRGARIDRVAELR